MGECSEIAAFALMGADWHKKTLKILGSAFVEWKKDRCEGLAAALSFFSLLSVAPLIACILILAVFLFGSNAVVAHLRPSIRGTLGAEGAQLFEYMLRNVSNVSFNSARHFVGFIVMLIAASEYFRQLDDALEVIWGEPRDRFGFFYEFYKRGRALAMAFILAVLMLAMVEVDVWLHLPFVSRFSPGEMSSFNFLEILISYALIFIGTFLLYHFFVRERLPVKDAAMGAAVTALLQVIGRIVASHLVIHDEKVTFDSVATGIVVLLIWTFYASMVLLYGAEVTQEMAQVKRRAAAARGGHAIREATPSNKPAYKSSSHPRRKWTIRRPRSEDRSGTDG